MNLTYWGGNIPVTDTTYGAGAGLPVIQLGPISYVHVGTQTLSISDSTVVTLTVPAGAVYARIQVNGGAAWWNTTGTSPVIATGNGYKTADLEVVELHGYDQLANFKVRAHTGVTGKIYVEYKQFKKNNVA